MLIYSSIHPDLCDHCGCFIFFCFSFSLSYYFWAALVPSCTVWKCKLTSPCTAGSVRALRRCHRARLITSWSAGKAPTSEHKQASLLFSSSSYGMKCTRRWRDLFVGGMGKRRGWALFNTHLLLFRAEGGVQTRLIFAGSPALFPSRSLCGVKDEKHSLERTHALVVHY